VIARVAVVPHPPLLVPEVAAGAAVETAALRAACLAAAGALAAAATRWVAVAAVDVAAVDDAAAGAAGTFSGYGVDVTVGLGPQPGAASDDLPLPLLVAGWLRGRVGPRSVTVHPDTVSSGTAPVDCVRAGRALAERLAAGSEPVGLLVLGDGAATHTPLAPGYLDIRAEGFDAAVAAALGSADLAVLLALDAQLAAELRVAGREAWQVGAAAAQAAATAWRGELLHSAAPYGVAYHVALWEPVR
jgi:aromatic ring-opening dioxygenase LigB subunit